MTLRSDVRMIQINKLGEERFMPEGAQIEDKWEPIGAFFGNMEPWLIVRRKLPE